jgi:peroxiredoxin
MLSAGDTAPTFAVEDTEGTVLDLDAMVASGPVILAFYPKAFTPG